MSFSITLSYTGTTILYPLKLSFNFAFNLILHNGHYPSSRHYTGNHFSPVGNPSAGLAEGDNTTVLVIIGSILIGLLLVLLVVLLRRNSLKEEQRDARTRRSHVTDSRDAPHAYGQQLYQRSVPASSAASTAPAPPAPQAPPPRPPPCAARRAFDAIDTDHSGFITRSELAPYLRNLPPDTAEAVYRSLDGDRDDRISFEEFAKYFFPVSLPFQDQTETEPEHEKPVLGICANYLLTVFPELAQVTTKLDNPNFYEMSAVLAAGPTGLGYGKTCPRDGKPGCSIVDAVEPRHRGQVTHFLSWCWAYKLKDFVSAIGTWAKKQGLVAGDVFIWICFFCNNQYRILESATQTGSDELKTIFESHLSKAGRMLIMLDSFESPAYVTRAWCIFETYVCFFNKFPMTIILPERAEDVFRQRMEAGGLRGLRDEFGALDVRSARASSEADQRMIRDLILRTTGYDVVNEAVKQCLLDQLTYL
ncbi:Caln1, partial [Symbiodinium pilosum]